MSPLRITITGSDLCLVKIDCENYKWMELSCDCGHSLL
jgi:hypothetical protein